MARRLLARRFLRTAGKLTFRGHDFAVFSMFRWWKLRKQLPVNVLLLYEHVVMYTCFSLNRFSDGSFIIYLVCTKKNPKNFFAYLVPVERQRRKINTVLICYCPELKCQALTWCESMAMKWVRLQTLNYLIFLSPPLGYRVFPPSRWIHFREAISTKHLKQSRMSQTNWKKKSFSRKVFQVKF